MALAREAARQGGRSSTKCCEPILTIDEALAAQTSCCRPRSCSAATPTPRWRGRRCAWPGRIDIGGQEHFYLEGQVAMAIPGEDGDMLVHSSTQHPTEVQHLVARALELSDHAVVCETRRMGGGVRRQGDPGRR